MPKKSPVILDIRLSFPKTPGKAKDRKELYEKFKLSLQQETPTFEEVEFDGRARSATLLSEKFLWYLEFKKPIRAIIAVKSPEENIDKMNTLFNKLVGYLNAILGDIISGAKVTSSKELLLKRTDVLIQRLIDESVLEKMNRKLKTTIKPMAIGLTYKRKERENAILTASFKKKGPAFLISSHVLKANIPWDLVLKEKTELNILEREIKETIESGG